MEGKGSNEKAPAVGCLKATGAVAKTAVQAEQCNKLFGLCIECFDGGKCLGDFLAVSTNVLDGCCARGPRDEAERLDTSKALFDGASHYAIPVFTRPNGDVVVYIVLLLYLKMYNFVNDNKPWKSRVFPDNVAATSNHHGWYVVFGSPGERLLNLLSAGYFA